MVILSAAKDLTARTGEILRCAQDDRLARAGSFSCPSSRLALGVHRMGTLSETVEARTRQIGREIFARAAGDRPTWGSAAWLDEKMMSLTMRDEHLKVQLFRFVDALPALKTDAAINRHLREYLGEAQDELPAVVRELTGWLPEDGFTGAIVARAARFNANRLARRFIAGTDVAETLRTIERLRDKRMGFTVDLLGEAVLSKAEALEYQRQY